jgi:hypothetical protein
MKRYKMDKWGQLPIGAEPTNEKGPWTVRSFYLILIPIVMVFVFSYLFITNINKNSFKEYNKEHLNVIRDVGFQSQKCLFKSEQYSSFSLDVFLNKINKNNFTCIGTWYLDTTEIKKLTSLDQNIIKNNDQIENPNIECGNSLFDSGFRMNGLNMVLVGKNISNKYVYCHYSDHEWKGYDLTSNQEKIYFEVFNKDPTDRYFRRNMKTYSPQELEKERENSGFVD